MVLIFQESFLWVRDYMITVSEFDILSISKNSFAPIHTQSVVTYAALLANDTIDLDYRRKDHRTLVSRKDYPGFVSELTDFGLQRDLNP